MENHDILAPSLQKYYSALKCLDDFGQCGNLFDDVSRLDSFFSEFRNITFIIQKGLQSDENNKIYADLRDNLLTGETLKWFVATRNKTTKQKPFPLKKELIIDVYLPYGIYRLKNDNFVVDFDDTFDEALELIKKIFINDLGLVEIFFSAKVRFSEDSLDVDLYPMIKDGISQMKTFMNKIQEVFPCSCDNCIALVNLIEPLYKNVLFKEINFVNDYAFEYNKELIVGDKVEMYLGTDNSDFMAISDMRLSLDNPIYGDANGCVFFLFEKFISSHIVIFQMQNNDIMPTFMIVFSDNTYKMIPFVATAKSTFYRKVNEIIEKIDFKEVDAVFFCGESYVYDREQFSEINEKPYSERIGLAKNEMLSFTMLLKQGGEMSVYFDERKINDMEHIVEQIQNMEPIDDSDETSIDWLRPIKEKLNPKG